MGLERNEKLHLSCAYVGREDDCPKKCSKCAISIKSDGDIALDLNRLDDAIRQYKKALFVEPKFAEAWCYLAYVYGMKSEYYNALSAFNKALTIDPQYGKAMIGKALTLRDLGKLDSAMALANDILELYDDPDVKNFKARLKKAGVKDTAGVYSLQKAINVMTDKAYEIIVQNNLSDKDGQIHTIRAIDNKKDFSNRIFSFCKRRYSSLGNEKVWSESILAAFYGSAYVALKYYQDPKKLSDVDPFDYLSNNVDLEELDRNVERLLGIRGDDNQSEKVWNIVYSFVTSSKPILEGVEPVSDLDVAIRGASECAYVMGMLLAMRHHDQEEVKVKRSVLEIAIDKLAESTKDYNYTPPKPSGVHIFVRESNDVPLYFRCDGCGQITSINVHCSYDDSEQMVIDQYKETASEFTKLGYPTTVKCYCNKCANKYFPSSKRNNNIVFSVSRQDCEDPIISFPYTSFFDSQYEIVLAFLRGAHTLTELAKDSNTNLKADDYLKYIHNVLGNVGSENDGK